MVAVQYVTMGLWSVRLCQPNNIPAEAVVGEVRR